MPIADPNCRLCNGNGWIEVDENGKPTEKSDMVIPCPCVAKVQNKKALEKSGLEKTSNRMTFETYEANDQYTKYIKEKAVDNSIVDNWWFIGGTSGSGKTHISRAICDKLINKGYKVLSIDWTEQSTRLKAIVNDKEYLPLINKLKKIEVLYIDDLFKAKYTAADIKLLYEIVNFRYNNNLKTLISSEYTLGEITSIDEAIGSRIYEQCDGYCINTSDLKNHRLIKG